MASRRAFDAILFSCEHGGARIPAPYRSLFKHQQAVLATHRGYDIGALPVAKALARRWEAPLFFSTVSRLVIDLNRSIGHATAFSEWTTGLSQVEKEHIIRTHYEPYRQSCESWIKSQTSRGRRVLHLSIHSFTPKLFGELRNADIGLLYDPKRPLELSFAKDLHQVLRENHRPYRIRRNYPYRGYADGFQTYLRKNLSSHLYAGLELEMNQAITGTLPGQKQMQRVFVKALEAMGL